MAEELDYETLQEKINDVRDDFIEKINAFVEESADLDIINNIQDLTIYNQKFPIPEETDNTSTGTKFVNDVAIHSALSDLINQRATENGQNYKQIALLLDLSFYFEENELIILHGGLSLLQRLFIELPTEWLLEFWPYINNRVPYIKEKNPGLTTIRTPGLTFIIAINNRIDLLIGNNEKNRDILRSKLLSLTTDLFPTFNSYLINKFYDINTERLKDSQCNKNTRDKSLFHAFWDLQSVFQDPYHAFDRSQRRSRFSIFQNMERVVEEIYKIENELHGPFQGLGKPGANDAESDNSLKAYKRTDLTEEQKNNLQEFYDKKQFNPSFFVSEEKFNDQLRNDESFRRVIATQMLITLGFIDIVISKLPVNKGRNAKPLPFKLQAIRDEFSKQEERRLVQIKINILELFSNIEKRQFFIGRQIIEFSELYFASQKTQLFTDFANEFSPFECDEKLKEIILKRETFKPRFWAAWGTAQISKHWRTPTGLELLQSDKDDDWKKQFSSNLEKLRDLVQKNNAKDLNNWKGLRLARRTELFKFKQADEETGIDGLYDPSIKQGLDEIKRKEEEERLEKEAKLKEERAKQKSEEIEEQKKRKANEELTEESRKKSKSDESNELVDLDY